MSASLFNTGLRRGSGPTIDPACQAGRDSVCAGEGDGPVSLWADNDVAEQICSSILLYSSLFTPLW